MDDMRGRDVSREFAVVVHDEPAVLALSSKRSDHVLEVPNLTRKSRVLLNYIHRVLQVCSRQIRHIMSHLLKLLECDSQTNELIC